MKEVKSTFWNGKLIHEGDVLDIGLDGVPLWEVYFQKGKWYIRWIDVPGYGGELERYNYDCRIVGNINKNPELLNSKFDKKNRKRI